MLASVLNLKLAVNLSLKEHVVLKNKKYFLLPTIGLMFLIISRNEALNARKSTGIVEVP